MFHLKEFVLNEGISYHCKDILKQRTALKKVLNRFTGSRVSSISAGFTVLSTFTFTRKDRWPAFTHFDLNFEYFFGKRGMSNKFVAVEKAKNVQKQRETFNFLKNKTKQTTRQVSSHYLLWACRRLSSSRRCDGRWEDRMEAVKVISM